MQIYIHMFMCVYICASMQIRMYAYTCLHIFMHSLQPTGLLKVNGSGLNSQICISPSGGILILEYTGSMNSVPRT